MKYTVHYGDNAKDIDYRESIDYDGPVEDLLKKLCEEHETRFQRMMKGLSERDPERFTYSGRQAYRFEVSGNEARMYTIEDDINVLIITVESVR